MHRQTALKHKINRIAITVPEFPKMLNLQMNRILKIQITVNMIIINNNNCFLMIADDMKEHAAICWNQRML